MEGVPGQQKALFEVRSPSGFNEVEVTGFVVAVDFISDNGMGRVGEVDTDLVHSAGDGTRLDERKTVWGGLEYFLKLFEDFKMREGICSVWVDRLFEPDRRLSNRTFS